MPHEPRTIVITGATRGLGRALAEELARRGHRVCGCGRSSHGIGSLRAAWPEHQFDVVDVAREDDVRRWAEKVLPGIGAPDLLINNASLTNHPAPLWRIPRREFDAVVDVNLKGMANVIRFFVPAMIRRDRGIVVNMSSGWGRSVDANVAPYCATKWGIEGMTGAMALELPPTMAAVALNPGIINTDMLQISFGEEADEYPPPSEWVEKAVPFLLSLGPQHNAGSLTVPGVPT